MADASELHASGDCSWNGAWRWSERRGRGRASVWRDRHGRREGVERALNHGGYGGIWGEDRFLRRRDRVFNARLQRRDTPGDFLLDDWQLVSDCAQGDDGNQG